MPLLSITICCGGHPSSWAARGAGGLSWPSAQGTQQKFMSPFVLCPLALSAVMQKLRNRVPGYPESSEFPDLTMNLGGVFLCTESSFVAAVFLQVLPRHAWAAITLFYLLNFCVVSDLVFSLAQDLIQEINELRLRVGEMDNERLQYEKKLKTTKVSEAEGGSRDGCMSGFRSLLFFFLVLACTLQNPEHIHAQGFDDTCLATGFISKYHAVVLRSGWCFS